MVAHRSQIDNVQILGSKLGNDLRQACTGMSLSASSDQVTQITMGFSDPKFSLLKSGIFKLGATVHYQDFNLTVTNVDTQGGGTPGITLKARSKKVQDLKNRRGAKAMSNVSPSDFVISECKAIKAKYVVQSSGKQNQVSRDVRKSGETYDSEQVPSSWTTFQRLAQEIGFICFESNDTIFFGKPSWLLSTTKKTALRVTALSGNDSTRSVGVPECSQSIDQNRVTTVNVTLPINRFSQIRVGRALYLSDMPKFKGYYLITGYDVDLAGNEALISVTAETPVDPVAQPPQKDEDVTGQDYVTPTGALAVGGGGSYKGHWPLPSKYRVGTPFGKRGNWGAGYHTGADLPCPDGTPVYAVYDGKIVGRNSWGSAYGNHIILEVSGKGRYGYCHLSRIGVMVGQKVRSGDLLGYSGHSGRAFGPHLHFELRLSPYRYNYDSRDPIPTLMKTAVRAGSYAPNKSGVGSNASSGSDTVYQPGKKRPSYAGYYYSRTASGFTSVCLGQVGDKYVYGAEAALPKNSASNPSTFDCSELVQWAAAYVGVSVPDGSYNQYAMGVRKNTDCQISTAIKTRGALLFKGPYGSVHVAVSLGNGQVVEAANPTAGVRVGSAYNRGWSVACLIPGMKYANVGSGTGMKYTV